MKLTTPKDCHNRYDVSNIRASISVQTTNYSLIRWKKKTKQKTKVLNEKKDQVVYVNTSHELSL